ncbi:MAG TPA: transcription elongation factor GreB [Spirochaetes bacterium]|nr:transcription elongation factor GreB [Spirochaetota bacterium]
MSRAFVSESDADFQEDDVPAIKIPLPPGAKNYMTPEGAEKMRSELSILVKNERPKVSAKLSRTVTESERLDRETMLRDRRRLREIDRRIEYLTEMADIIEVVDPSKQDPQRVLFGAAVTVEDEKGLERIFRIVGVDESDPSEEKISWLSPVAKAMFGAREGEVVGLKLPQSETKLKVLRISYL